MSEVKTEFNSSIATLERIDTLLKWCRDAQYIEDFESYFRHLRNLRKEALCKMKHETKRGECTDTCILCTCIVKYNQLENLYILFKKNKTSQELTTKFCRLLDEYETFLRQFMDKKGMLMSEDHDRGV